MNQSNFYIFVLWERARENEEFLFTEIKKKFVVNDVYEIEWNKDNFPNNLRRFYGPGKIGDVDKKTKLCKTGPFLLIIISDSNPTYKKRRTSKGMELVNVNVFETKKEFRKQTNKGYAIHSSLTKKETNDDLTMLLGKNLEDIKKELDTEWNGSMKKIKSDLVGQNGWKDMPQLLYVLNSTINYVVLRNHEGILDDLSNYKHADIDILTDEYLRIPYITNGGKASFNEKFPTRVKVGNTNIIFDFGYPEDGYYDKKWAKEILKRRVLNEGIYIPSTEDYFYSLFYHMIYHQKRINTEYKEKLYQLSKNLKINETNNILENYEESKKELENYMKKMKYGHPFSNKYKIRHNKLFRLIKISILLWRTQGAKFLFEAIKGKIKRNIPKLEKIRK